MPHVGSLLSTTVCCWAIHAKYFCANLDGIKMSDRKRPKSEVVAFGKLFAALTTMKRKDRVSEFDVMVYEERTAHVPLAILSRAVTKILDTHTWFPTVSELLEACEAVRLEMRARFPFQSCERCEDSAGWVEYIDTHGIKRFTRCDCWKAHMEKVRELAGGAPDKPLALPAPEEFEAANE